MKEIDISQLFRLIQDKGNCSKYLYRDIEGCSNCFLLARCTDFGKTTAYHSIQDFYAMIYRDCLMLLDSFKKNGMLTDDQIFEGLL